MLILSNCLTSVADEGCLKVANSLVKRIKAASPDVTVVSYERRSPETDQYLELNKLLLNKSLFRLLRRQREPVLYIPFPARSISIAIRCLVLSVLAGRRIHVLLAMTGTYGPAAKLLMRMSGTRVFALSEESAAYYAGIVGTDKTVYLKTGIDTNRFVPVSAERVKELKKNYGLDPDRKTVLHVGHLKKGRNLAQLLKLDNQYQVVLVVSTLTQDDWDEDLRKDLLQCPNIRILERYIPEIQEVYQLSDLYFFPVESKSHCIDAPLSALEAAACGKPVVTTEFGELKAFLGKDGFYFLDSFEPDALNDRVEQALKGQNGHIRDVVLEYDWNHAVSRLLHLNKTEQEG